MTMVSVHTHPLWRRFDQPDDEAIRAARLQPDDASCWKKPVVVSSYDSVWPISFALVASRVRAALGARALCIEHIGSTSVPGLAAKPIIDVDLLVPDASDEASYVPQLAAEGFTLVIREPDWEEHRVLKFAAPDTNLHVFSSGAIEPQRHLLFRDWLRSHPKDRDVYANLKQQLAGDAFDDVMLYNNAKSALIFDIYESIFAADPQYPHTPRAR